MLVTLETKVPVSFRIRLVWMCSGSWFVGRCWEEEGRVCSRERGRARLAGLQHRELAEEDVQVVAQAS